ncbi:MAG: nucleotidyltransferase family protein [Ketobacter sp.]|nr:MAG: nucleotidyltransferase family protein [Ketobacter sp.]
MNTGIIILAAGNAVRFGSDKRIALLNGKPLLMHAVDCYSALDCPILLVCKDIPPALRKRLTGRVEILQVPDTNGVGDSLAAGVQNAERRGWDAALIALGDMPCLKAQTASAILEQLHHHDAVVPVFDEQWGHPVGFRKVCFQKLAQLAGDKGGRSVLKQAKPHELQVNDPGVLIDVDDPEQLIQAIEYIED